MASDPNEAFRKLFEVVNETDVEAKEIVKSTETALCTILQDGKSELVSDLALSEYGWNGSQFDLGKTVPSDFVVSFSQKLGNAYLRHLSSTLSVNSRKTDTGVHRVEDEKLSISFCANMLYCFLRDIPPDTPIKPTAVYFTGACLLADISGFTKLSGQLCQGGISGLDLLQVNMRDYIGKIIDIVYYYGGDGELSKRY